MIAENFIKLYEKSFRENWNLECLTDYGEANTFTYGEVAKEIARIHLIFKHCQLRRGDKVAIIGKNNTRWCISFLATITYGAIVVPILQDFNPSDVHYIINHSESSFLFTSDLIWERLEEEKLPDIRGAFSLTDFRCLYQRDGESIQYFLNHLEEHMQTAYPQGFRKEDVAYTELDNDKVILINYTSGTTGFSKGVMLTGNNLAANVVYGIRSELLKRRESVLSFLPLAHMYGCAFDFLTAIAVGTHVTLLGKTPSPKILLTAFEEVKPNLIITVPLVIEKIYKNIILPLIQKTSMKMALSIPMLNAQIYAQIRKKLVDALGGRFKEVIIGGATLNPEVEEFFHRIKFPFPTSSGKLLGCFLEARISKANPSTGIGELEVRGENVMKGYYKNEDATREAFTEDGWLRTGDLGSIDVDHNIYLRGRTKTVILGSNGQIIFPEELESRLNNLPFVLECLVVESNKKLVALVYPDFDALNSLGLNTPESLKAIMDKNLDTLNKSVGSYEKVSRIQIFPTEFEKTPKRSIKRYLYNSVTEN